MIRASMCAVACDRLGPAEPPCDSAEEFAEIIFGMMQRLNSHAQGGRYPTSYATPDPRLSVGLQIAFLCILSSQGQLHAYRDPIGSLRTTVTRIT